MRKLIAGLACRVGGQRLYGKPLQNLVNDRTILDQILETINHLPAIATPVLGISEGIENQPFVEIAKQRGIPYIIGDEIDVLSRLIACGREAGASDVFRVTTECPFLYTDPFDGAWLRHVDHGNDLTATDNLPIGTHFEIYTLDALVKSHERGTSWHRSEGCSRYIREHRGEFQVEVILPPPECAHLDLRLTVDYPEDLVVCRHVYRRFEEMAPLIPVARIVAFLDENPWLKELVAPYASSTRIWPEVT